MKNYFVFPVFFLAMHVSFAQFAPPAGQKGTTAMHKDSSAFIAWATGSQIKRGYQDISNPSSGFATLGDSTAVLGKADGAKIVSLGDGGSAIITFKQAISNEPGYDFAVFENGFSDTFLELGFVEVSSDGVNYFRFAATSNTQDSVQMGNDAEIDARKINNLAGKYRANYGTPFDLQELAGMPGLDVSKITHVKIIDVVGSINPIYATYDKNGKKIHDAWPTPFPSCGLDLDAVGVIHQAPVSVEEEDLSFQFQVFPNPVTITGKIHLTLQINQPATIELMDLTGRLVSVIAANSNLDPTPIFSLENLNLKAGIYLLSVRVGEMVRTKKISIVNE